MVAKDKNSLPGKKYVIQKVDQQSIKIQNGESILFVSICQNEKG